MKADSFQQLSLLELAELDVELSRLNHRAAHLPEQQRYTEIQAEQGVVNDRLSALTLALEDIDAQVTRLESEIDGVRQREDRDRGLLDSGSVSPSSSRSCNTNWTPCSGGRPAWRTACSR